MRRLLHLLLALCLLLPGQALAQEEEPDADSIGNDEGYEPDQRGAQEGGGDGGEDTSDGGEPGYEPDQRGATEETPEPEGEPRPVPRTQFEFQSDEITRTMGESEAISDGGAGERRGLGLDFELWLGAGVTGLDAIEGDNLVLPTQQGGIGGSFGASLRLGLGPLSFGPRASFTVDSDFVLGAVGIDIRAALMRGGFVPTLRLALSYTFLTELSGPLPSQPTAGGVWTELGLGGSLRIMGPWTVGVELAGGWLALFRDPVPMCVDPCTDMGTFDLRRPGQSHGLTLRMHLFTGVSF